MDYSKAGLLSTILAISTAAAVATDTSATSPFNAAAIKRASSCTFSGSVDPTQVAAQLPTCTSVTLNAVTVPPGKTLDLSVLADGTAVNFQGVSTWGVQKGFAGPLLNIGGKNIVVTGQAGAKLDGQGSQYWDGQGSNGNTPKPKFLAAHNLIGASSINNLYLLNTPVQAVSINGCSGLTVNRMTIDNSAGNGLPSNQAPKNTDGFDIGSSTNVIIDGAVVQNQDDCVAINSGTGITFQNGQCIGGHGLSVGSVGHGSSTASNTVSNINFLSSSVTNSANGIRVKSFWDGQGKIDAVTYSNITLNGIAKFGILIEQNYEGGDLSKTHNPGSGVSITGLTVKDITGNGAVSSTGTNVAIACANCSGWTWTNVLVTGGKKFACQGTPPAVPAGTCAT